MPSCFFTQFSKTFNGERVIASDHAGTFFVIIPPAPTFAPSSIATGATRTEFEPILTLSPITVFDLAFVSGL